MSDEKPCLHVFDYVLTPTSIAKDWSIPERAWPSDVRRTRAKCSLRIGGVLTARGSEEKMSAESSRGRSF